MGPAGLVAATAVVLWSLFDVGLWQIVRYIAYEAGFTALPGVIAFMAVTRTRRLGLYQVALGWGLGYALGLAAFATTAAIGK